jgi:prevent-host-death family protein
MNARTEFQVILGQDGKPAFVVVPYEQFRRMQGGLHMAACLTKL